MEIVAINVSTPKVVTIGKRTYDTGIYKDPVEGRVMVRRLNLDGDRQADLRAHGGPYKAVYAYPQEHYAFWQENLGRELPYGTFGENLTVTGLLETDVHVGDVIQIGEVRLQATQPRVPCFKLANKIGDPTFVKTFMEQNRTGFYLRVLQEGEIGVGDMIERVQFDAEAVSIQGLFHLLYVDNSDVELAQRALRAEGLPPGWVGSMREIIEAADNNE